MGSKNAKARFLHCALQHSDSYKMEVLIGEVCGKTAYYHGEDSLSLAIIGMALDFVGANNINLLIPRGRFGSRRQGGSDAGRSRYLSCQLNPIPRLLSGMKTICASFIVMMTGAKLSRSHSFPSCRYCSSTAPEESQRAGALAYPQAFNTSSSNRTV
jgi:hypothetical protein